MTTDRTIHILLVEDDDVDAEGVERAFRKHRIANPITVVRDGIDALAKLRGDGVEPLPRPYLILLDLNMPRMNGIEFLKQIRQDEALRASIVFVLTTSDSEQDKVDAYNLNVSGYMVKARAGEDFWNLIHMLDYFWQVVEFPPDRTDG